jgi:hypothetical protein
MDYIRQLNAAWARRSEYDLTSVQWDVYSYLLKVANERAKWVGKEYVWPESIKLKNTVIAAALGMTENTLIKSRNVLAQKGFIVVDAGRTKSFPPTYYLIDYCNKNSIKDSNKVGNKASNKSEPHDESLNNCSNDNSIQGGTEANIYKENSNGESLIKKETTTTNGVVVPQVEKEDLHLVDSGRQVVGIRKFHFVFTTSSEHDVTKAQYLTSVNKNWEVDADREWLNDWILVFADGEALSGVVVKSVSEWIRHLRNWWKLNIERIIVIDPKTIKNGIIPKQNTANNIRNTTDVKLDTTSTEWR